MGAALSTKRATSAMVVLGVTALEVAPQHAFALEGSSFGEAMAVSQPYTRQYAIEKGFANGNTWSDVEERWSDTDDENEWPPRDPKNGPNEINGALSDDELRTKKIIEMSFTDDDSEEETPNTTLHGKRLIRLMGKRNTILSRDGISARRLKKGGERTDGDSGENSGPESEWNGISAPSASDGNSDMAAFDVMGDTDIYMHQHKSHPQRIAASRSYVGPTKFPKRSDRRSFMKRVKARYSKRSEKQFQVQDNELYNLMAMKDAAEREVRRMRKKRR